MAFERFRAKKYPARLWALVGYPGSGKSTFATTMRGPILPVDADGRFSEVVHLTGGDVYQLSDRPSDNTDPEAVARLLTANMPGSRVGTIVVDSLTAIIVPMVTKTVVDNAAGRNKNRVSAFADKALAMRQLQDAVSRWGCDVLWIYHLQDARDPDQKDDQGRPLLVTRPTLSSTERARLYRSLNLELQMVQEGDRRGVKVVWARRGRTGVTIWDDTGRWVGMPEKIESAVYDGLTEAEIAKTESAPFPSAEAAIAWGLEQGAFDAVQHSRNAYIKLKNEKQPRTAAEMAELWRADVARRLAAIEAEPAQTTLEPAGLFAQAGVEWYNPEP